MARNEGGLASCASLPIVTGCILRMRPKMVVGDGIGWWLGVVLEGGWGWYW